MYMIPTPWVSSAFYAAMAAAAGPAAIVPAAAAWPSANRAIYIPVWFPFSTLIVDMRVGFTTAAGNYDIGLYDSNFGLIEAKGSAAVSNAAHIFTLTKPQRVRAGAIYYAALVLSSISDSCYRSAPSGVAGVSSNLAQEALGSTTLPSTATPAVQSDPCYVPLFAYGLR